MKTAQLDARGFESKSRRKYKLLLQQWWKIINQHQGWSLRQTERRWSRRAWMLLRLEEILMHSWECSNRTLTTEVMREVNSSPEIFVDDGDCGREMWLVDVRGCLPETECLTCVVDENVTFFEASLQTGHYARLGWRIVEANIQSWQSEKARTIVKEVRVDERCSGKRCRSNQRPTVDGHCVYRVKG